ncbi:hypothetical protein PI95_034325 [Hassallia byssoidea VB512170]|uniref:Uncharacterized protein n=1 Tax=Hassallia byssoidea VB512170 TaxID=1304833 RepID=A0A846HIU8_9CYAN|nr:hypothetical protein [Hassalia byssoidea]NEU77407.1 hypothetical protein [Hassalia byssoidea VB512170]
MLIKINRQEAISKYPKLPLRAYNSEKEDYDFFYPETFTGYVLTLPSKSFKGHIKLLGKEIADLTTHLGFNKLIFLGDLTIPWLYLDHNFKQAKEALQFLADNKIGRRFTGALQVDTDQLPTFVKHLSWLVRTNAILPYVHFIDPGQNVIGTICQYGNLHIYTVNKKANKLLEKLIDQSKFECLTELTCDNKFSKISAIKGRQLNV